MATHPVARHRETTVSRPLIGYAAAAVAVAIWAGWIVAVRFSVTTLSPLDVALLRYGGPALLLAPVWLRRGPLARGAAPWRLVVMTAGWGAPFALYAAQGLKAADIGLFAALVPGAMPLWVAAFSALALGARYGPRAGVGLALIAAAAALALVAAPPGARAAAPWLFAASASWAAYTLAYRGSGLSPVEATALVAFWSTLALVPVALIHGQSLSALPAATFAAQFLVHGVLSGAASVAAYALAIRELGAARAAASSALVPGLAALGGVALLGEALPWPTALAVGGACVGVGLLSAVRPPPAPPPAR